MKNLNILKRTVLITGAGGGLGQALVNEFFSRGWDVIATDTVDNITRLKNPDPGIRRLPMDVTSEPSIQAVFEELKGRNQDLDLIINNSGIDAYFPLSETPVGKFRDVFEVNVFGSYRVNRAFLPLIRKPGGRIIHVSSESVKINVPFMPYPLSKQALEGYCRTLRLELRFLGVDVTIIRPGAIRTPFLENLKNIKNPVENSQLSGPFEKFARQARQEVGKTGEPEVVARFIFRIASLKRTRMFYAVNNDPKLSIAAILPFRLLENFVYRRLK
jgi:NAD(P)-dependent dehydrogenase (short-subunit alcohol dehydrogenase family)